MEPISSTALGWTPWELGISPPPAAPEWGMKLGLGKFPNCLWKIPKFPQRNSAVPALGAGAVVSLGFGLRVMLIHLFREFLFGEIMVFKALSSPDHSVIKKSLF